MFVLTKSTLANNAQTSAMRTAIKNLTLPAEGAENAEELLRAALNSNRRVALKD